MKKIIFTLALVFSVSAMFAQECRKTCEMTCNKANSYVLNNDLIEATLYHDNGQIAQTGYYNLENKLQNQWASYDEQGKITAEGTYNNGVKVGTWYFYQGDEKKEVTYDGSKIAEVKTWSLKDSRVVVN